MTQQLPNGDLLTTLHPNGSIDVAAGSCAACGQQTKLAFPSWGTFILACNVECFNEYENKVVDELFDHEAPAITKKQAD